MSEPDVINDGVRIDRSRRMLTAPRSPLLLLRNLAQGSAGRNDLVAWTKAGVLYRRGNVRHLIAFEIHLREVRQSG